MVCFIVAYFPADSKPGGEKSAQTGEEVKGKRGKTLLWSCALALAGGEPPRARGELTFGKLAEQDVRLFPRTFPGK